MKKKRMLPKVVMAASVAAMGVGVFQTFDAEAQTTGGGVCCQMKDKTCYHPDNISFADSIWKSGASTCS
ncbi:hypothetical protein [Echinicola rosea]|uniref:hypothetical protein n=1 Tax=Echinicola rosea TaxID=1807691 RepID=UPI0010CA8E00|nr:hypothetical protein [Echinicola rosea]